MNEVSTIERATNVHLDEEGARVTIWSNGDEIGLRVFNGEQATALFLDADQARALARQLSRRSSRITHPTVAARLDAGDVPGAAEAFLELLENRR